MPTRLFVLALFVISLPLTVAHANFPFHKATRIVDASDGTELYFSDVCVDGSNQIHVVWSQTVATDNDDHLFYRRYNSAGAPTSDIIALTPPGYVITGIPRICSNHQSKIAVSAVIRDTLAATNYWYVWYSDGSGVLDPPVQYSSDQPYSSFGKGRAGMAINASGRSVIGWDNLTEPYRFSTYYEVRDEQNQKIDTARATRSGEWLYSNPVANRISMNSAGRFVIVWHGSHAVDHTWFQVWGFLPFQPTARVFDELGNPISNEIYVACEGFPATCSGDSSDFVNGKGCGQWPDVAMQENGDFAVMYCEDGFANCDKRNYFVRRFFADGTPKGPNQKVNDLSMCYIGTKPSRIISDSIGNLLVVWANNNVDGVTANWWCNLYAQRYDSTGQRIGVNYRLNDIAATYDSGIFGDEFGADMNEQGLVAIVGDEHGMLGPGKGIFLQTMDVHDIGFFTPGDANRDLLVNVSDPVFLINYIFSGGIPPCELNSADADGSCTVTISDAVYLINYIFAAGGPPIPGCVR